MRAAAAFAAVAGVALVLFFHGRILCFCQGDPDGCGRPCHVCGATHPDGLSADEPCDHLSFSGVDFFCEGSAPSIPARHMGCCRMCHADAGIRIWAVPFDACANAPPGERSDSAIFRVRNILLMS